MTSGQSAVDNNVIIQLEDWFQVVHINYKWVYILFCLLYSANFEQFHPPLVVIQLKQQHSA